MVRRFISANFEEHWKCSRAAAGSFPPAWSSDHRGMFRILCRRRGHSFSCGILGHCRGAQAVAVPIVAGHRAVGEIEDAVNRHGVLGIKPRHSNAKGKPVAGVEQTLGMEIFF